MQVLLVTSFEFKMDIQLYFVQFQIFLSCTLTFQIQGSCDIILALKALNFNKMEGIQMGAFGTPSYAVFNMNAVDLIFSMPCLGNKIQI